MTFDLHSGTATINDGEGCQNYQCQNAYFDLVGNAHLYLNDASEVEYFIIFQDKSAFVLFFLFCA